MTYYAAAAIVGSALIGAYSSNKASKAQQKAQQDALNAQTDLQAPFREAGLTSQNRLLDYMGLGKNPNAEGFGKYTRDFSMADYQADPGYQFRLKEGLRDLDRKMAMRGGSLSGNAIRAGQEYAQNLASQEYQNAFNRYQINRSNQLNPLQSLMGAGQTSTNYLSDASGNAYGRMGEARAAGMLGQSNALVNGINSSMNYYQGQQQLNAYKDRTSSLKGSGGIGSLLGGLGSIGGLGDIGGLGAIDLETLV